MDMLYVQIMDFSCSIKVLGHFQNLAKLWNLKNIYIFCVYENIAPKCAVLWIKCTGPDSYALCAQRWKILFWELIFFFVENTFSYSKYADISLAVRILKLKCLLL